MTTQATPGRAAALLQDANEELGLLTPPRPMSRDRLAEIRRRMADWKLVDVGGLIGSFRQNAVTGKMAEGRSLADLDAENLASLMLEWRGVVEELVGAALVEGADELEPAPTHPEVPARFREVPLRRHEASVPGGNDEVILSLTESVSKQAETISAQADQIVELSRQSGALAVRLADAFAPPAVVAADALRPMGARTRG